MTYVMSILFAYPILDEDLDQVSFWLFHPDRKQVIEV